MGVAQGSAIYFDNVQCTLVFLLLCPSISLCYTVTDKKKLSLSKQKRKNPSWIKEFGVESPGLLYLCHTLPVIYTKSDHLLRVAVVIVNVIMTSS